MELSRAILEMVASTPDGAVDGSPAIQAALQELEKLSAQHSVAVAERSRAELTVRELQVQRDAAVAEITTLTDRRGSLLASIFLGSTDPSTDRENQARRAELADFVERVDLALPHLQRLLTDLQRPVASIADGISDLSERLRGLRQAAKVEIARNKAA